MADNLELLLSSYSDFDICSQIEYWISHHYSTNALKLPDQEVCRTVYLVWNISGVIDNGGFGYFFGFTSPQNETDYSITLAAFQAIGADRNVMAFRKAIALFPNGKPFFDASDRIEYYEKLDIAMRNQLDYECNDNIEALLANYIRANREQFRHVVTNEPQVKWNVNT